MELYGYYRSSAVFRVRIALNLKGLQPELHFIHLHKGEQQAAEYKKVNPLGLVPALISEGGTIGQSLAIIEYLDELVPSPRLLPKTPKEKARVRQIALGVACEIHPLANLRVLNRLRDQFGADEEACLSWQRHWMGEGLAALEQMLENDPATGRFSHGNAPTLADIFLVPQLANARRAEMNLAAFPTLARIEDACYRLDAFTAARPENQPDAE
ncbi:MAG: maleylacetoacetate isomerase [Rhizomicrobium sp.]